MPRAKTHAAVILREYHKAESELIGKAVVLTDGKAGTVDLRLPTFLSQSVAPVAISMNRDNPRHMIRFPGGGSLARAR